MEQTGLKSSKTEIYKDLMTTRQGEKNALGIAAIVCGALSFTSIAGVVGSSINVDSAFLDTLRKARGVFVGSAIGTGVASITLASIREAIKERTELLRTVNGDYIENPVTTKEVAATYEVNKRREQNEAYKKDEITTTVIFGLSVLGIILANSKGEDPSTFIKLIKEIGPKPFTGAAVVSAVSGIISLLRSWAGNSRETHLIEKAFDVQNRTAYRVESGDRDKDLVKNYTKMKEAQAKREAQAMKRAAREAKQNSAEE